jgi:predicted transcriptional regulator
VADKQTILKLIRFFMSRNTFTKFIKLVLRQFNLNRKCTETHLRASTFSKIFRGEDPFLQRVEGMREGDSWERGLGRGEERRGMCSPNKT